MKSPLVDALRQAHGDTNDDPAVETDPVSGESAGDIDAYGSATSDLQQDEIDLSAERIAALAAAEKLGAADLNLLDTGSFTHAEAPLDESPLADEQESDQREFQDHAASLRNDESTDEPIDGQLDQLFDADEEQRKLSVDDAESTLPIWSSTATGTVQGARLERRMPLVPKLGRLSPVICLIALSASAGGYYIVNQVAAQSLNEDLNGMAQRMDAQTASMDTGTADLALNQAGKNIFADTSFESTVGAPNQTSSVPEKMSSTSDVPTTVETTEPQTARPSMAGEMSAGAISSSTTSDDSFHDRAHAFVVDAFAAYQVKDYALAETNYVQALEIEPNHVDALAGLAAVHLQTNRLSAALAGYERLLSVEPSSAVASSAILTIHAKDPEWDSESDLKLLLQQYPEAHQLHYALGSVFVGDKRWADAKQAFLAAHRLAPGNANYSYNAAVSMEKVGEQSAARFYYEAALATAGQESNIDRRAVSAHLETLKVEQRDQL